MKSITTVRYYPSTYLAKLGFAVAVTVILVLLLPQQLFAYSTTEQSAVQLTEDTFLFQITYRLNFMNYDLEVPILANRVATHSTSSNMVLYSLHDSDDNPVNVESSSSIVLSDAMIRDRKYFTPDRTPGYFTLVTIVKLTPEQLAAGGSAAMQVNWLPFTLIDTDEDNERTAARVPDTNLADYITPTITWQPTTITSQPHTLTTQVPTPDTPTTWK